MCGLAGFHAKRGASAEYLQNVTSAMIAVLRHRGPDDSGIWQDSRSGIALGFRRLSIVDLSATGHQPMESPSSRYVVVFNGEIYNYRDLRRELITKGRNFRGTSDTEVLLTALDDWG